MEPPSDGHGVRVQVGAGTGTGPNSSTALPTPVQLTFGGSSNGMTHGLADFVAQEEMDRYRGFWWSLDSSCIAFTEVGVVRCIVVLSVLCCVV